MSSRPAEASDAPNAISAGEDRRPIARVTSGVQSEFAIPKPAAADPASAAPTPWSCSDAATNVSAPNTTAPSTSASATTTRTQRSRAISRTWRRNPAAGLGTAGSGRWTSRTETPAASTALARNATRQLQNCASAPPMIVPAATPAVANAMSTASFGWRSRSATVSPTYVIAVGIAAAKKRPARPRPSSRTATFGATAETSAARPPPAIARRRTGVRPKRSDSPPQSGWLAP